MTITHDMMIEDLGACKALSTKGRESLMRGMSALESLTEVILPCEQGNDAVAVALMHMYAAFACVYRAEFHAARAKDTAICCSEAQATREAIDNEPPPSFDEDE